jgi:hypothetical protein
MKFVFEIKTVPALHTAVVIMVVVTSSSALATIAVSLANLPVATYCVTVLALIIWIAPGLARNARPYTYIGTYCQ